MKIHYWFVVAQSPAASMLCANGCDDAKCLVFGTRNFGRSRCSASRAFGGFTISCTYLPFARHSTSENKLRISTVAKKT